MNVLYVGDIMGEAGIKTVEIILPKLIKEKAVDIVIAQAENVSEGRGMTVDDYQRLRRIGVDGFSGGNHTPDRPELTQLLNDPAVPVVGPANMPDCPGPGYKYVGQTHSQILMISLLGQVVGRNSHKVNANPLLIVDEILDREKDIKKAGIVVNFHGDFSSEKVVIGHYLDGRASLVVGDHWHVPTADARILPGGTAHMTDIGMCGVLNSSLGVTYDSIVPRWKTAVPTKNVLANDPPFQFNALLVSVNQSGLSTSIEHIQKIIEA